MKSIQRIENTKEKLLKDSRALSAWLCFIKWKKSKLKLQKNSLKTMYYEGKEKDIGLIMIDLA